MVSSMAIATLEELEDDPYPLLARLRASRPVAWLSALGGWLVTRRDLALEVMRDADDVHRRRPALLDRTAWSGRACSRATAPSTRRHRDPFAEPSGWPRCASD